MMHSNSGITGWVVHGMTWDMWLVHTIIGMLFIILIVYVIYWLFAKDGEVISLAKDKPVDILKMRYAKGQITKEQFERMKKEID